MACRFACRAAPTFLWPGHMGLAALVRPHPCCYPSPTLGVTKDKPLVNSSLAVVHNNQCVLSWTSERSFYKPFPLTFGPEGHMASWTLGRMALTGVFRDLPAGSPSQWWGRLSCAGPPLAVSRWGVLARWPPSTQHRSPPSSVDSRGLTVQSHWIRDFCYCLRVIKCFTIMVSFDFPKSCKLKKIGYH